MYAAQLAAPGLGLNPLTAIKKGAKAVGKGAKAVGKGVKKIAKSTVRLALIPEKALLKYVIDPVVHAALTPIRNAINKIVSRRAKKLSWDKRKSLKPTPVEVKEARAWTRQRLRGKGPHGKLIYAVSTLAGPDTSGLLGTSPGQLGLDPATTTLLVASVPVAVAIVNATANALKSKGAPEDPRAKEPTPEEQKKAELELQRVTAADEAAAEEARAEGGGEVGGEIPWWGWALIGTGTLVAVGATVAAIRRRRATT